MPWSKLDDGLHENAKVSAMSDKAFRLFICAITYASRHRLAGKLTGSHLAVLYRLTGARLKHTQELVDLRAWNEHESGYIIHGYSEYNPSPEEISRKRSEAGKLGASSRWQNGKVMANASTPDGNTEWQTDGKGNPTQTRGGSPIPDPVPVPIPNPKDKVQEGRGRFAPPTFEQAEEEFVRLGFGGKRLGERFVAHYQQSGWKLKGGAQMRDWKAAVQTWVFNQTPGVVPVVTQNGTAPRLDASARAVAKVEAQQAAKLNGTRNDSSTG